MRSGILNNVHYFSVPKDLTESNLAEVKSELDRVLGDIIDHGLTKFIMDLSGVEVKTPILSKFIFKVMEDCNTLNIKVRYVATDEFARQLFGTDLAAKLALYKNRDLAAADF